MEYIKKLSEFKPFVRELFENMEEYRVFSSKIYDQAYAIAEPGKEREKVLELMGIELERLRQEKLMKIKSA